MKNVESLCFKLWFGYNFWSNDIFNDTFGVDLLPKSIYKIYYGIK